MRLRAVLEHYASICGSDVDGTGKWSCPEVCCKVAYDALFPGDE